MDVSMDWFITGNVRWYPHIFIADGTSASNQVCTQRSLEVGNLHPAG
jgi:hypothetical protein